MLRSLISPTGRSSEVHDEEYDEEYEKLVHGLLLDARYLSRKQAIANIAYAVINAALVALPYAAYQAGLGLYILSVVLSGLISGYTTCIVIGMANDQKVRTLEALGEKAFGSWGFYSIGFLQITFSGVLMCLTLDVWADIMNSVWGDYFSIVSSGSLWDNALAWLLEIPGQAFIGGLLILPLCVGAKSMISLRFNSYCAVLAIIAVFVAVAVAFFTRLSSSNNAPISFLNIISPQSTWWSPTIVIPFCFSYNQKVFTVYSCLARRNSERWQYSVRRAIILVSLFYVIFGIFGYLSRSLIIDKSIDNINYFIADNLCNKTFYTCVRVVISLSLLATIPVDCLVAASTLRRLWRRYAKKTLRTAVTKEIQRKSKDRTSWDHQSGTDGSIATCECCQEDYGVMHRCCCCFGRYRNFGSGSIPSTSTLGKRSYDAADDFQKGSHESLINDYSSDSIIVANSSGNSIDNHGTDDATGSGSARTVGDSPSTKVEMGAEKEILTSDGPKDSRYLDAQTRLGSDLIKALGVSILNSVSSPSSPIDHIDSNDDEKCNSGPGSWRMLSYESSMNGDIFSNHIREKSRSRSISIDKDGYYKNKARHLSVNQDEVEGGTDSSVGHSSRQDNACYFFCRRLCWCGNSSSSETLNIFPGFLVWLVCVVVVSSYKNLGWWLGATVGVLSTSLLVYIIPSMIYFRVGLSADFEEIPICGFLRNRVYMYIIQAVGLLLLTTNIVLIVYYSIYKPILV